MPGRRGSRPVRSLVIRAFNEPVGATPWLLDFMFEAAGDWQWARFKANPANRGKFMDRGFWRYARHPDYFGDFAISCGF
jgi:steroid 5-alpha reductase family enzyme